MDKINSLSPSKQILIHSLALPFPVPPHFKFQMTLNTHKIFQEAPFQINFFHSLNKWVSIYKVPGTVLGKKDETPAFWSLKFSVISLTSTTEIPLVAKGSLSKSNSNVLQLLHHEAKFLKDWTAQDFVPSVSICLCTTCEFCSL